MNAVVCQSMRAEIVDQLLQISVVWECDEPVFFLAVQILDRFAGKVKVDTKEYQLAGCVALLLASKYEGTHLFISLSVCKHFINLTESLP